MLSFTVFEHLHLHKYLKNYKVPILLIIKKKTCNVYKVEILKTIQTMNMITIRG